MAGAGEFDALAGMSSAEGNGQADKPRSRQDFELKAGDDAGWRMMLAATAN